MKNLTIWEKLLKNRKNKRITGRGNGCKPNKGDSQRESQYLCKIYKVS